jgi:hypothetical protein
VLEVISQLRTIPACYKCPDVMNLFQSIEERANDRSSKFDASWKDDIVKVLVEKATLSESIVIRDLDRTIHRNSSLSNTLLGIFIKTEKIVIHSITLTKSTSSEYSRLNLFLYDDTTDYSKPLPFLFKPGWFLLFKVDLDAFVELFVQTFWRNVVSEGYIPCDSLTAPFSPLLTEWVKSGILLSNGSYEAAATFEPKNYPLSMFISGFPGAGKSSFVRCLTATLGATVNQLLDPQVKINTLSLSLSA